MYIDRPLYLKKLLNYKDKDIVKIITGVRRCGKSILLNHFFYAALLAQNVREDHILRISLDLKKWEHLRNPDKLYEYVKGQIKDNERYYVFLDEIQMVERFEEVVNSIKGEFNSDVYITGSNSKLLSSDINTIFRGRGIEIRLFPLSFKEYFEFRKTDRQTAFNEYLLYGGFPYAATEPDKQGKAEYLKMLCDTLITRDMIERYKIRDAALFEALVDLLCSSIGSYVSPNKIANTLKSSGFKTVDNETVSRYLSHVCDAFLFQKVQRYDIKGKEYLKTQNKYYISDTGIRNARLNYRQTEITHLLENIVYLELLRRGCITDIGKNRNNEIDFIASALDGTKYYIQVAATIEAEDVLKRETRAFAGIDDGYRKLIITMDSSPFVYLDKGYRKLNVIDFLLDENSLKE